ncbi:MAG TPA: ester cyclase [Ktedonobacteraceae bacterium]|jgi:predicted ester cyclase
MREEDNKHLVRRVFEEVLNQRPGDFKLELVDKLFSSQFRDHSTPDQPPGPQGVKDYFTQVRTGFPDLHVTLDDVIAENDRVVVRTTWRGTHLGNYAGQPPTGRAAERTMIQIFRVVDGKLQDEWNEGSEL